MQTSDLISAADEHGYVRATVGHAGRLRAISIKPHAMYDLSADDLAAACLEAVTRAQSIASHPGHAPTQPPADEPRLTHRQT
jgi:hypothetical protein